ncbi:MAG TPA: hypothetical protein VJN69_05325 [Candidatus Acidoferrales bacterium]|nr:hypothetical protein [Candidatus Acidoferrales bacterium]
MEQNGNYKAMVAKMDDAFGAYFREAEKLSILLGVRADPCSWTSYHDLQKQQTAETVSYERYRVIREQVLALIPPPVLPHRPESSVD